MLGGVGLTPAPAAQVHHVNQPDSLLWPPAWQEFVETWDWEIKAAICSISLSKQVMIFWSVAKWLLLARQWFANC